MKHELRGWGLPACVCGYRIYSNDKSHARKMMDLHFGARHDFYEHVEIINQLVGETARLSNPNQDVALAILHLVEILQQIDAPRYD